MRTVFVIIYLALLGLYLFVEVGDSFRRRAVNKILLSSLFLFFGQFWFWTDGYAHGWSFFALVGLFYTCMGDALLLFSFGAGGTSFAVANLCFIGYTACTLYFGDRLFAALPWVSLGLILFLVLFFWSTGRKWIDLEDKKGAALFYMFTVTCHGLLGLLCAVLLPGRHTLLLGIGLTLFMVSDYFLVVYKFKSKRKRTLRCNTACYFLGMMLVALSFSVPQ